MTTESKETVEVKKSAEKHYSRKRKVLSTIVWIINWPLIIGFIGFILAIVVGNTLVAAGNVNSPSGPQMRGMWALYVGVLVLTCYGFIWLKSRQKNPLKKISVNVLRTYMWLGIIIGAGIAVIIPDPEVSTANAGIDVQQTNTLFKPALQSDATINASLARVGATDTQWVETKFVHSFDSEMIKDQAGTYQAFVDTAGNWSYGVLTVKQDTPASNLDSVVAHEYLHHVWYKALDSDTKTKLGSDLISLYGNDTAMQERVKSYAENQILQPTELFSFYCTEVSDRYLTQYVLEHCSKYINRSTLRMSR